MNTNKEENEQNEKEYVNDNSISDIEKKKEEQERRNEWLKEKMQLRRKQQIQFIITQTNYDEVEATQRLEECNYDVMKVVNEYLGISVKSNENVKKSKNQKIFSVIRDIMDSGSRNFMNQQEKAKKIEEFKKYIEIKNKQNQQCEKNVKIESSENNDNNIKTLKTKID